MKSVINYGEEKRAQEYPCLKKAIAGRSLIVLFYAPKCGVSVVDERGFSDCKKGRWSDSWGEHNFSLFEGSITLSNN